MFFLTDKRSDFRGFSRREVNREIKQMRLTQMKKEMCTLLLTAASVCQCVCVRERETERERQREGVVVKKQV